MPFKPAAKEVGYAKGSFYGPKGTGKTTLMAMVLMYLSKKYHNSAPVAWLASEKGVDFVVDIFKDEGVPLLLNRSRSFIDLRAAARDAKREGCCAVGVDSVSHFWADLFSEGMKAPGPRLAKIGRIKEEWAPFAQDFQDSPIHFFVTGRMGFVWDEVEMPNENGELVKELSKGGTKIKAEGDFGHEPDVEIETTAVEDPDFVRYEKVRGRARKTFKSQMLHVATVKKCRVWALNGKAFYWKDQTAYKLGYYKQVAEAFQPYFDSINIGGSHAPTSESDRPSSSVLFQRGDERSAHEQMIQKQILLEKWDGTMAIIAGGQTKDSIHVRAIIGQTITKTRSRTEFERTAVPDMQRHLDILLALEQRLKTDKPKTDDELIACIQMATEDTDHPGKNLSFVEAMTYGKKLAESQKQELQEAVPF